MKIMRDTLLKESVDRPIFFRESAGLTDNRKTTQSSLRKNVLQNLNRETICNTVFGESVFAIEKGKQMASYYSEKAYLKPTIGKIGNILFREERSMTRD